LGEHIRNLGTLWRGGWGRGGIWGTWEPFALNHPPPLSPNVPNHKSGKKKKKN